MKTIDNPKPTRRERETRTHERLTAKLEAHAERRQGPRLDADALRRSLRATWDRLRPFGVKPSRGPLDRDYRYPVAAFRAEFAAEAPPAIVAEETVAAFYVRNRDGEVSRRFFEEDSAVTWANVKNSCVLRDGDAPLWYVERVSATVRTEGGGV